MLWSCIKNIRKCTRFRGFKNLFFRTFSDTSRAIARLEYYNTYKTSAVRSQGYTSRAIARLQLTSRLTTLQDYSSIAMKCWQAIQDLNCITRLQQCDRKAILQDLNKTSRLQEHWLHYKTSRAVTCSADRFKTIQDFKSDCNTWIDFKTFQVSILTTSRLQDNSSIVLKCCEAKRALQAIALPLLAMLNVKFWYCFLGRICAYW
jgi:hypothetical protein